MKYKNVNLDKDLHFRLLSLKLEGGYKSIGATIRVALSTRDVIKAVPSIKDVSPYTICKHRGLYGVYAERVHKAYHEYLQGSKHKYEKEVKAYLYDVIMSAV